MINKVILVGRIGKDVEIRYSNLGAPVASFSIATTEKWKDKNSNEKKEKTTWHNVTAFGNLAETVALHLHKGNLAYLEGKLDDNQWEDKHHQKRLDKFINLTKFQNLSPKTEGQFQQTEQQKQQAFAQQQQMNDDDPPF